MLLAKYTYGPRPRRKIEGVDVVVSLLKDSERPRAWQECERYPLTARKWGPTVEVSPVEEFVRVAKRVKELLEEGKRVHVHCHAGLDRSTLVTYFLLREFGYESAGARENAGYYRRPSIQSHGRFYLRHYLLSFGIRI